MAEPDENPTTLANLRLLEGIKLLENLDLVHVDSREAKAFNDLLDLAEEVSARRDIIRRDMTIWFGASVAAAITATAAAASLVRISVSDVKFQSQPLIFASPLLTVFVAIIFSALLAGAWTLARSQRLLRRETKAFEEVMSVVHEVYQVTRSQLSSLETARVKIRLSRLDN